MPFAPLLLALPPASGPPWTDAGVWAVLFAVTALAAAAAGAMRWLAPRCGAVDAPDGDRKRHRKITPLWGGVAVMTAFVAGVGLIDALGLRGPRRTARRDRSSG